MITRKASATWEGGLKGGKGSFKAESGLSGTYCSGRASRTPSSESRGAAGGGAGFVLQHGASVGLEKNGTPPTRVETSAGARSTR